MRAGRFGEIDREHLIEEIESMGRSERAELENRFAVLLAHLLKWRHQPVLRSRGLQLTIIEQRRQIARRRRRNPSLQYRVAESLEEAYGDALILAKKDGPRLLSDSLPVRLGATTRYGISPSMNHV